MPTAHKFTVHFYHLDYIMAVLSIYAHDENKAVTYARQRSRFLKHSGRRPTHIRINQSHRIDL